VIEVRVGGIGNRRVNVVTVAVGNVAVAVRDNAKHEEEGEGDAADDERTNRIRFDLKSLGNGDDQRHGNSVQMTFRF